MVVPPVILYLSTEVTVPVSLGVICPRNRDSKFYSKKELISHIFTAVVRIILIGLLQQLKKKPSRFI